MHENIFSSRLSSHLYKTITVYTVGYNRNQNFTGTLAMVYEDYISLILTLGVVRNPEERQRSLINFNRQFNQSSSHLLRPGCIAEIPIDKITAIIHYSV